MEGLSKFGIKSQELKVLWNCVSHLRKVGVPSMQDTMGLFSPPFSKSCAEIFLTGVLLPPLDVDFEPVDRDLAGGGCSQQDKFCQKEMG